MAAEHPSRHASGAPQGGNRDERGSAARPELHLALVAHDLQAPLRAIDGYSAVLLEESLSALGVTTVASIRNAVARMSEGVNGVLGLCRIERTPLDLREIDLRQLAEEVSGQLRMAYKFGGEVRVGEMPGVYADAPLLRLALQNLVSNAMKFSATADRPQVEIGARGCSGNVVLFVRDNGVGFDMAQAGRLFTPFQRLHCERQFEGAGIGLAIVDAIARRHGGRAWAEGVRGEGATFHVSLPAAR